MIEKENNTGRKITKEELGNEIRSLFSVTDPITDTTDLSLYIKDSIDLGELRAVITERYGVPSPDIHHFKTYTCFGDVLKVFNREI